MIELQPPDSHHLLAAQGWLELGNPREATVELARLGAAARSHPAALQTEWEICSVQEDWSTAVAIGQRAVALVPESPSGWINRSYALHELRRTAEARDLLLPAAAKFPKESTVAYNLACYTCQLGELDESQAWLKRALQIAPDAKSIKDMAMQDRDLAALRPVISNL